MSASHPCGFAVGRQGSGGKIEDTTAKGITRGSFRVNYLLRINNEATGGGLINMPNIGWQVPEGESASEMPGRDCSKRNFDPFANKAKKRSALGEALRC